MNVPFLNLRGTGGVVRNLSYYFASNINTNTKHVADKWFKFFNLTSFTETTLSENVYMPRGLLTKTSFCLV